MLSYEMISKITDRAEGLGLLNPSRISMFLDLEIADQHYNLKPELMEAEKLDFMHDILGIQEAIDRTNKCIPSTSFFLPRYAGNDHIAAFAQTLSKHQEVGHIDLSKPETVLDAINRGLKLDCPDYDVYNSVTDEVFPAISCGHSVTDYGYEKYQRALNLKLFSITDAENEMTVRCIEGGDVAALREFCWAYAGYIADAEYDKCFKRAE